MPQASVFQPHTQESFSDHPDLAIIGAGTSAKILIQALESQHPNLNILFIDEQQESIQTTLTHQFAQDRIIALSERDGGWLLKGVSGQSYAAKKCVLATGQFPPKAPHPHLMDYSDSGRYINDPSKQFDLESIDREENILILGSGLRMVKMVEQLQHQKHLGEIISLSSHGLVPQPIGHETAINPFAEQKPSNHLATLLGQLRLAAESASWPAVIDGLIGQASAIWHKMHLSEKKQFLRHLQRYWNVVRHRMDDSLHDMIFHLKATGQLRILSGHLHGIDKIDDTSLAVRFHKRGSGELKVIMTHKIINASNPNNNVLEIDQLLIQNALNQGYIHPHLCGLGIQLGDHCEAISNAPRVSKKLFAIGPLCQGEFYECTDESALSDQAERIAAALK